MSISTNVAVRGVWACAWHRWWAAGRVLYKYFVPLMRIAAFQCLILNWICDLQRTTAQRAVLLLEMLQQFYLECKISGTLTKKDNELCYSDVSNHLGRFVAPS